MASRITNYSTKDCTKTVENVSDKEMHFNRTCVCDIIYRMGLGGETRREREHPCCSFHKLSSIHICIYIYICMYVCMTKNIHVCMKMLDPVRSDEALARFVSGQAV